MKQHLSSASLSASSKRVTQIIIRRYCLLSKMVDEVCMERDRKRGPLDADVCSYKQELFILFIA